MEKILWNTIDWNNIDWDLEFKKGICGDTKRMIYFNTLRRMESLISRILKEKNQIMFRTYSFDNQLNFLLGFVEQNFFKIVKK